MSAAHTRRPWVIKFRNDSSCYISMGDPAGEHKQFDLALDARYPSDVADARLIVAAPDLLEALKELRLAREQDKYPSWEKGVPEFNKAEALADAAITKATGEGA